MAARKRHLDVDRGVVRAVEDGDVAIGDAVRVERRGELYDRLGLRASVPHVVETRLRRAAGAERTQRLLELVRHVLHHRVRHVENRGHAAVVALELQHLAVRPAAGELADVLELRAAPRVDALEVVAHHHDVAVLRGEDVRERGLEAVRVLVLVHEHVLEMLLEEVARLLAFAQETKTVHEEVVEVHRAEGVLLLRVGAAHLQNQLHVAERGLRLVAVHHALQALLAVRGVGDELQEELLLLEVLDVLHVVLDALSHEFLLVVLVEDREAGADAKGRTPAAEELVADRVEGAAPDARHAGDDALRAFEHLARGAVREREQQDALRRHALLHQIRHAVHERARLARAGGRQHEHRPVRRRRRRALLWIEYFRKINHGH